MLRVIAPINLSEGDGLKGNVSAMKEKNVMMRKENKKLNVPGFTEEFLNFLLNIIIYGGGQSLVWSLINPLVPSVHKSVRIAKISILKLEGVIKKISNERRDYESVDEKSLS